ncbi:MAG: hypothetical protein DHS20C01_38150 [marine bacterium B5-7]|nr:MAG: hypothetical protein DHS20C01_38150 [marine bacterium B5-7]
MRNTLKALLFVGLCTTPVISQAQNYYIGVGVGQSRLSGVDSACDTIARAASRDGLRSHCDTDDTATSLSLFGGYEVNEYFAVEGGYTDYGDTAINSRLTGVSGNGSLTGDYSVKGIYLAGVGKYPIGDRFAFFIKAGAFSGSIKSDVSLMLNGKVVATSNDDDDGTEFMYGAGIDFIFNENSSLRLGFDRINTDEALDNAYLGFIGHF